MITRSLKLQLLLLFEWLQWNLTWIKSDRSCQNKFSRSIFWYLCVVCQLITWAGLIRHPACRSALIVPFLTKPPALRIPHILYNIVSIAGNWFSLPFFTSYVVVHAVLLVRQHTVQQYNFLLRVSGSEFAQAFINSRQSKLFASLLYIQSWLFLTKIC